MSATNSLASSTLIEIDETIAWILANGKGPIAPEPTVQVKTEDAVTLTIPKAIVEWSGEFQRCDDCGAQVIEGLGGRLTCAGLHCVDHVPGCSHRDCPE